MTWTKKNEKDADDSRKNLENLRFDISECLMKKKKGFRGFVLCLCSLRSSVSCGFFLRLRRARFLVSSRCGSASCPVAGGFVRVRLDVSLFCSPRFSPALFPSVFPLVPLLVLPVLRVFLPLSSRDVPPVFVPVHGFHFSRLPFFVLLGCVFV